MWATPGAQGPGQPRAVLVSLRPATQIRPTNHTRPRNVSRTRAVPKEERRTLEEMRDSESDPRYRRVDYSVQHAFQARRDFLRGIEAGEAAIDLAAVALHIAAEDDALVSHSSVQLPVAAYQQRLKRMAAEFARQCLPEALERRRCQQVSSGSCNQGQGVGSSEGGSSSSSTSTSEAEAVLKAMQRYLYEQQGFCVAAYGRSNLPAGALVDHPGVWEKAGHAYLNEVLVSRCGIPAALAIVLADLVRQLLLLGAIDFAVHIDCQDLCHRPRAKVLPGMMRAHVVRGDGTVLNTCTSKALEELLRFLKRCYWPYPWSTAGGGYGGFAGAATVFLEGEADAAMQAINRTAQHRLEQGIWTSPGGGDIRRAVAACERLALLCGTRCPLERRDLAVLYMHVGRFREAKAELLYFMRSPLAAPGAMAAPAGTAAPPSPPSLLSISPTGAVMSAGGQSLAERTLTERLLHLLSGVEAAAEPLTLQAALAEPPPHQQDDGGRLPLTCSPGFVLEFKYYMEKDALP